jgi:hypothetical protein
MMTDEQQSIMRCRVTGKDVILIKAFAGSGKTFILTQLAHKLRQEFPSTRILYLAYNKAIALEAREKFPEGVDCMTTHGLACRKAGRPYFQNKKVWTPKKSYLKKALDDWYHNYLTNIPRDDWPKVFSKWIRKTGRQDGVSWEFVNCAWESLGNFFNSCEYTFDGMEHVDPIRLGDTGTTSGVIKLACNHMWKRMKDLNDRFPMVHDGYLKLYDIQKEDLGKEYKIILFDEAQDANGAQLNIVKRANACKIVVGDEHQQIYAWRGSVNALDKFNETQSYRLSNSFRFGENVAKWATLILSVWKEEDVPVKGKGGKDLVHYDEHVMQNSDRYAYICRTNAEMFSKAVECLREGRSFGFVGGFPEDLARSILDVYYLWSYQKDEIVNKFYATFPDFEALNGYARKAEDLEVTKLIGIVNKYRDNIPHIISDIRSQETDEKYAATVLVTGHRSKGLEWDDVVLAPDFLQTFMQLDRIDIDDYSSRAPISRDVFTRTEQANLLYVVATRARKQLGMPPSLYTFMVDSHDFKKRADLGEDIDELELEYRGDAYV